MGSNFIGAFDSIVCLLMSSMGTEKLYATLFRKDLSLREGGSEMSEILQDLLAPSLVTAIEEN
jgi:hypothetical protein